MVVHAYNLGTEKTEVHWGSLANQPGLLWEPVSQMRDSVSENKVDSD